MNEPWITELQCVGCGRMEPINTFVGNLIGSRLTCLECGEILQCNKDWPVGCLDIQDYDEEEL